MNYKREIKKMLPEISNQLKLLGGGLLASFNKLDKLKYNFLTPVMELSQNIEGKLETYFVMYVDLVNVNGFLYPAEMFKFIKIRKDLIDNSRTYNIYLKKEYEEYSTVLENSIELKDVPERIKNELRLQYDISEIGLTKKIIVSFPTKLIMIDGKEDPFVVNIK